MHRNRKRLGLCPISRWESSQRSPYPLAALSWDRVGFQQRIFSSIIKLNPSSEILVVYSPELWFIFGPSFSEKPRRYNAFFLNASKSLAAGVSPQTPLWSLQLSPKTHSRIGLGLKSGPPLREVRFLLQLYSRLHGFKYEFSKVFWGGAHRSPSPDPSPAQARAPPSIRASPSILGRFAPSVRALPLILLGRFAPSVRASPSIHPPPQHARSAPT